MMHSPAHSPRQSLREAAAQAPLLAPARWRWLALGGALLWLYAAWAPWLIWGGQGPAPGELPTYTSPVGFPDITATHGIAPYLNPVLWGLLTPLGLLISPWLWSRRFRVVAAGAFAAWVVVTTLQVGLALAAVGLLATVERFSFLPPNGVGISLDFGVGLAVVAPALAWPAAVGVVRHAVEQIRTLEWRRVLEGGRRLTAAQNAPLEVHARVGLATGGAGIITVGVLIWAVSDLFMPWALEPCPDQLIVTCTGLPASQAMEIAALPARAYVDPQVFRYALPVLLAGGALMAIYVARRLQVNFRSCAWIATWLLVASAAVALGLIGTQQIVARGGIDGLKHLMPYPAGWVAVLGLGLGWLGLIPLVMVAFQEWRAQTHAPN
jgi:hypothetical protein